MPDRETPRLEQVMVDCSDPRALARFWGQLLERRWASIDESLAVVDAQPLRILFQQVAEAKTVKNRLHLDVHAADAEAGCARAVRLGARRTGHQNLDDRGEGFVVLQDPEGHEFCLVIDGSGAWDHLIEQRLAQEHGE